MFSPVPTLGTLLRSLIDRLDGEVEAAYVASDLVWRPRYTPVLRVLMTGPTTLKAVACAIGVSHSAVSQTVAQMNRDGLVALKPGQDARERIVALTPMTEAMLPALQRQWAATNAAAAQLEAELSVPLSTILGEAIAALDRRPFGARIAAAAETLAPSEHP